MTIQPDGRAEVEPTPGVPDGVHAPDSSYLAASDVATDSASTAGGVMTPSDDAAVQVIPDEAALIEGGGEAGEPDDAFHLQLGVFSGPLELLLHLIERQELDITEVSLFAVTEQYLAFLRDGEQIDLGALAEFIAVGARLLLLKSRALLPRDPDEAFESDEDEADADPADLLAALQEYRRIRAAADYLRSLENEHRTGYRRDVPPPEVPLPTGLDQVTLDRLMAVFAEVLTRLPAEPAQKQPRVYQRSSVRLQDRVQRIAKLLDRRGHVPFREIVEQATSRLEVIVDFLAVLELIKSGYLEARQEAAFGEIELVRRQGALAPSDTAPLV